jgi:hypothetical protein
MKKIWSLLFVVLTLNSVAQTKSNLVYDNNAQKRSVTAFKGVKVSSAIDLYLTQSDVNEVAVSASSNEIRDRIITEVEEGVLVIRFENSGWRSWSWGDHKMKAYVSIKNIESLQASGASNVKVIGSINSDKLKIKISGASDLKNASIKAEHLVIDASGASDFKAEVNANTISVDASGASTVSLNGNVDDAVINSNGASDVKAYDLSVKAASLIASGASDIHCTVTKIINVDASGASTINYKGEASMRKYHSSGASNVHHRD